jgi:hypothetical protein
MENLDSSTYILLQQFLEGGGQIVSFTRHIPYLDGQASPEIDSLLKGHPDQCLYVSRISDPLFKEVTSPGEFEIREEDPARGELYHQRRILEDGQLVILVNSSSSEPSAASIQAKGKSAVSLDPVTGRIAQLPAVSEGKRVSFRVDLPPLGSSMVFISEKASVLPMLKSRRGEGTRLASPEPPVVSAEKDNILVMNYLDLKSADLDLKDTYFMDALLALFESKGLEMGNPWQHKVQYRQDYLKRDTFPEGSGFSATYHFRIAKGADLRKLEEMKAVVEGDELWDVYVNGHPVQKEEGSWWIDRDFHYFPIGEYLKDGENELSIRAAKMSLYAELMPAYLVGPFLVHPLDKGFEITPGILDSMGSWKEHGYPFYSQKVAYSQHFEIADPDRDYLLKLNAWEGTTAEILVNREKAGQICWPPYELEVGDLIKEGDNEITVKVVGSLKNTFGHFFKTWYSFLNGPHDWNASPEGIPSLEQYSLKDYGLHEPFDLVIY